MGRLRSQDEDGRRAFSQLLRTRRERIKPEQLGLPSRAAARTGPPVPGVTQTEIDIAMNSGIGVYQKVESGALRPSPGYLLQLARTMRFKESEYVQAHVHLYGTEPKEELFPDSGTVIPAAWEYAVHGQLHMSYAHDRSWRVRFHNAPFRTMFPSGQPPANMAEWFLLSDEARDVLMDYDRSWGPYLMPQFRLALSRWKHDPELCRIYELILDDKRALRLWDRGETTYMHPDGDRRPMNHGTWGEGEVILLAGQPLSSPGARQLIVPFLRDGQVLIPPQEPTVPEVPLAAS
ncbi:MULTISPECIES: MmyB family transcriptional regulator [Streptomyces]|uniref:MmyB family transcriptional regulator n=1 Tax=Streptomyces TaxID=1883 RepID=UPI0004CDA0FF|nr:MULTISPECIES: hypothetical protein [Streptomyces]KOT62940.1 hypothetical protein ADK43_09155 [Streptomyces rimosus subsp. rimosus]